MSFTVEQTVYAAIPTGNYAAKVTSVEVAEGKFGKQIQWKFEILDRGEDWDGQEMMAWSSMTFSPKSKLYKWANAIVFQGLGIDENYVLDSEDLIGSKCTLVVVETTKEDGSEFSKIDNIKPSRAKKAKSNNKSLKKKKKKIEEVEDEDDI